MLKVGDLSIDSNTPANRCSNNALSLARSPTQTLTCLSVIVTRIAWNAMSSSMSRDCGLACHVTHINQKLNFFFSSSFPTFMWG